MHTAIAAPVGATTSRHLKGMLIVYTITKCHRHKFYSRCHETRTQSTLSLKNISGLDEEQNRIAIVSGVALRHSKLQLPQMDFNTVFNSIQHILCIVVAHQGLLQERLRTLQKPSNGVAELPLHLKVPGQECSRAQTLLVWLTIVSQHGNAASAPTD